MFSENFHFLNFSLNNFENTVNFQSWSLCLPTISTFLLKSKFKVKVKAVFLDDEWWYIKDLYKNKTNRI